MEQNIKKDEVNALINVIKETYDAKCRDQKWIVGFILLLCGVFLVDEFVECSSVQEFFKEEGVRLLIMVFLLLAVLKNRFFFRKMSESQSADEILARYQDYMKWDRWIQVVVFVLIFIVLALSTQSYGLMVFFGVFSVIFLLYNIFGNPYKDENIDRLRELVQEDAKKVQEV